MMHLRLLLPLLLFATDAGAATLSEGQIAYRQFRVTEARHIYQAVLADAAASGEDRAGAARELARIAWLVDGQARPALNQIDRAVAVGEGLCDTAILAARILREAGRQAEAAARGAALAERCDDPAKRDLIRLQIVDAWLERAVRDRAQRNAHLDAAAAAWRQLGADGAASLAGSRARMELGLLRGDPDQALQGWRSYFWLVDQNAPAGLASYDVPALLRGGVGPGATDAGRAALAELLVRAGFVAPARHFASVTGLPGSAAGDPAWRRVAAYFEQRARLDALMVELNRSMALRHGDPAFLDQIQARMERELATIERALAAAAIDGGAAAAAAMSDDDRDTALLDHYGIYGTDPGRTSGYPSLHLGHATRDSTQEVSIHGRNARVHFVELDNMIANGFHTWLWDGNSGVGGWATEDTIVGVRPGYTTAPLTAYALLGDGPTRRELLASQPRLAQEDLERLRAAPVAYLRGLDDRLRMQALDRVAAVARARIRPGVDFRRAFLDEYYRAVWYNGFDIHEGRHVVDYAVGAATETDDAARSAGLEYRAKLTEVQLADYPRLALSGMLDGNIGDSSGHGQGNFRVMDLFRRWIEAHPAEILGYDPAVPALAQLDKLTDEQMRAVARSADPLANTSP